MRIWKVFYMSHLLPLICTSSYFCVSLPNIENLVLYFSFKNMATVIILNKYSSYKNTLKSIKNALYFVKHSKQKRQNHRI